MENEFIDANEKGAEGENFVNEIAFKSFIKYWCYPRPLDITGDYKEICDLLVVFNTICIIVSVKNYHFKEDYNKYFKKTVDKVIRQINGAERKLFGERPVLLKHPDRKEIVFDKRRIKSIYRIVVNLNTSVKHYQTSYFDNDKHYAVMDAEAWFGALLELNSLPDFVNYITARCLYFSDCSTFVFPREEYDFNEAARIRSAKQIFGLASKKSCIGIILGSELDLIAYYITKGWSFPKDSQLNEEYGMCFFDIDGSYVKYKEPKAVDRKEEQEREKVIL